MSLLHPGDAFPELTLTVPGGKTVTVPEVFAGQIGVVSLLQRPTGCLPARQRHSGRRRRPGRRPIGR